MICDFLFSYNNKNIPITCAHVCLGTMSEVEQHRLDRLLGDVVRRELVRLSPPVDNWDALVRFYHRNQFWWVADARQKSSLPPTINLNKHG